jgi:hypothetical protein
MVATLIDGYGTLAEWLWLIAAILFVVAGILTWAEPRIPTRTEPRTPVAPTVGALMAFGLTLLAVGWLVV